MTERFSERYGLGTEAVEISVRYDAPQGVRTAILRLAEDFGMLPTAIRRYMRSIILSGFDERGAWTDYPNVWDDINDEIQECAWPKVYDIAEVLYRRLKPEQRSAFQSRLNRFMAEEGIGLEMKEGEIEFRGDASFEVAMKVAQIEAEQTGRSDTAKEIREAIRDLSERPEPDLTGAVQHSIGALEAVAREVSGKSKPTLGPLIRRLGLPRPLDASVEKLWGFSNERARHIREGGTISDPNEAELVATVACAVATYISKVARQKSEEKDKPADADDLPFE